MTRQATLYEYAGDDYEQWSDLRKKVVLARKRMTLAAVAPDEVPRSGDTEPQPADELAEAIAEFEAFEEVAISRATAWQLTAIGWRAYQDLLEEHPPRKVQERNPDTGEVEEVTDPRDVEWGVNTSTFPEALMLWRDNDDAEHRTVMEPSLTADQLKKRVRRLSKAEFDLWWRVADSLNSGRVADPKAMLYSMLEQT